MGPNLSMFAKYFNTLTVNSGAKDRPADNAEPKVERRARTRTQVHWPVLLLRHHGGEAVETVTLNLSSSGFYCMSSMRLTPGEQLFCTLRVPSHDPANDGRTLSLECVAIVIRSELTANGTFGVAFRIEDYQLSRSK